MAAQLRLDGALISSPKRIRRGVSCAICRQRKVACDTAKPTCGNCTRGGMSSECFYPGLKKTLRLPLLVERIKELEEQVGVLEASSVADRLLASDVESWYWSVWDAQTPQFLWVCWKALVGDSLALRNRIISRADWWSRGEDPPLVLSEALLVAAMNHSYDFGLEFNAPRLLASVRDGTGPHPAVINVLYLMGCYYTPGPLHALEPYFLGRVRRHLQHSLQNVDRIVDFLKASAILTFYYLFRIRTAEAANSVPSNITFAVAAGLHDLSPPRWSPERETFLPPPRDRVELGERITVWWLLFMLDRGFHFMSSQRPIVVADERIRTVWPQPSEEYERGEISTEPNNTVHSLYDSKSTASCALGNCVLALRAKSFALFERSARVGATAEKSSLAQFKNTDRAIRCFLDTVPPIYNVQKHESGTNPRQATINPLIALVRTLALGAMIQLHQGVGRRGDAKSLDTCIEAINEVIGVIYEIKRLQAKGMLSKIMGLTWLLVKSFLERELQELQKQPMPDRVRVERIRLDLEAVKWAFQKVHDQLRRYAINQNQVKPRMDLRGDHSTSLPRP
ncbi:hypothetical protein BOTBODRAFT_31331 [Botryobasidium botryosum FD-172 SS1]|uniref:Zn(2)-C6 fungal-type domain-containing protein n=1 Tax=Botryobasidium botryosum (strain FD-172 SS1) TaxID=930990 RepID=A0A067MVK2_BOTB1|nr:hypothetical protein BOTBODRAFT_31331 [Botryobasidium botryosum FD-172 SS1]